MRSSPILNPKRRNLERDVLKTNIILPSEKKKSSTKLRKNDYHELQRRDVTGEVVKMFQRA